MIEAPCLYVYTIMALKYFNSYARIGILFRSNNILMVIIIMFTRTRKLRAAEIR